MCARLLEELWLPAGPQGAFQGPEKSHLSWPFCSQFCVVERMARNWSPSALAEASVLFKSHFLILSTCTSPLSWEALPWPPPPPHSVPAPPLGKTALLHALASSDGVQIHNTENIRLLLQRGEAHLSPGFPRPLRHSV